MITSKEFVCIQYYFDQEEFAGSCFPFEHCRVDAANHLPLAQAKTSRIMLDGQQRQCWSAWLVIVLTALVGQFKNVRTL
jgi:hypothetical protein